MSSGSQELLSLMALVTRRNEEIANFKQLADNHNQAATQAMEKVLAAEAELKNTNSKLADITAKLVVAEGTITTYTQSLAKADDSVAQLTRQITQLREQLPTADDVKIRQDAQVFLEKELKV